MTEPNVVQVVEANAMPAASTSPAGPIDTATVAAPIDNGSAAATPVGAASVDTASDAAPTESVSSAASTESSNSARAAFLELSKAYQDLATRNAANLKSSIQAIAAVKSAAEFIEVEKRLIKEGVQAAVSDSKNIAHLTAAVFTAAFEPVKKHMEAMQKPTQH